MSDIGKDDCIILNKCIYDFVHAKRQYYKKAVKIIKNLGFIGGNVNPCLCIKKSVKDIVHIAHYIGNNLMVSNIELIDNAISAFNNNWLVFKVLEGL